MKVLDTHGNYGTVVRFTQAEWSALERIAAGLEEAEDE